jgi:hypothetical protein
MGRILALTPENALSESPKSNGGVTVPERSFAGGTSGNFVAEDTRRHRNPVSGWQPLTLRGDHNLLRREKRRRRYFRKCPRREGSAARATSPSPAKVFAGEGRGDLTGEGLRQSIFILGCQRDLSLADHTEAPPERGLSGTQIIISPAKGLAGGVTGADSRNTRMPGPGPGAQAQVLGAGLDWCWCDRACGWRHQWQVFASVQALFTVPVAPHSLARSRLNCARSAAHSTHTHHFVVGLVQVLVVRDLDQSRAGRTRSAWGGFPWPWPWPWPWCWCQHQQSVSGPHR